MDLFRMKMSHCIAESMNLYKTFIFRLLPKNRNWRIWGIDFGNLKKHITGSHEIHKLKSRISFHVIILILVLVV